MKITAFIRVRLLRRKERVKCSLFIALPLFICQDYITLLEKGGGVINNYYTIYISLFCSHRKRIDVNCYACHCHRCRKLAIFFHYLTNNI